MSVYLDVPYVSQLSKAGGVNDPTGCWYFSAMMLAYYFEAGPRLGVPEFYVNGGHMATGSDGPDQDAARIALQAASYVDEHEALAQREHLESVADCDSPRRAFTVFEIEKLLRRAGPIFFYWQKTSKSGATYGHASVIIGVEDGGGSSNVVYHDPEGDPRIGQSRNARMTIDTFNSLRQRWKYAMMQRSGVVSSMIRFKAK